MIIEEQIKELNIEKLLVVDDAVENIEAAKQYFSNLKLEVEYASTAKEAIGKIKDSYKDSPYSLILSDLNMETSSSGYDVGIAGLEHQIFTIIATGRNYHMPDGANHGPNTYLMPLSNSIKGKKSVPEVWEQVFEKSLSYLSGRGKPMLTALNRFREYVGVPSESIAEIGKGMYENGGKK